MARLNTKAENPSKEKIKRDQEVKTITETTRKKFEKKEKEMDQHESGGDRYDFQAF